MSNVLSTAHLGRKTITRRSILTIAHNTIRYVSKHNSHNIYKTEMANVHALDALKYHRGVFISEHLHAECDIYLYCTYSDLVVRTGWLELVLKGWAIQASRLLMTQSDPLTPTPPLEAPITKTLRCLFSNVIIFFFFSAVDTMKSRSHFILSMATKPRENGHVI